MANRGIIYSSNNVVINPASRQLLSGSSAPIGVNIDQFKANISTLNKFETKCLLIQLSELESNSNSSMITVGVPSLGTYRASINANLLLSNSNVATISITNADNSDIKLGMIASIQSPSTGVFGSNTIVVAKSLAANTIAANVIPGFTYTITSVGTTDFTLIGANASVIGNVFVANAVGTGTGTALGTNKEIILGSNHTVSGDIVFNVNPLKLGKYQSSQWFLIKYGYINDDGTWANKDGIDTVDIFLAADGVQDSLLQNFLKEQYIELSRVGAIRDGDNKETVAGMLALAYQYQDLGNPLLNQPLRNTDGTVNLENYSIASRANIWRENGQTVDSQGRPGHIYFNGGRYAIRTLGADVLE